MAKYLDYNGLLYLVQLLKPKFDEKLDKSQQIEVSTVINAESTDLTAASSKAVREYVKSALANISSISAEIVDVLPSPGKTNVIYLVPKSQTSEDSTYDEYMWINDKWELIGTTAIDMSEYIKASDLQPLTNAEIEAIFAATEG